MQLQRKVAAVGLSLISAVTIASVASGGPSATKQRIAIDGRLVLAANKGTWTLIPLTSGPLKKDSGTINGGGVLKPPVISKNGQRVIVVIGKDVHTGKSGTFVVTQRVETVDAGHGWSAGHGTFTFKSGTGAYAGVTGGGAFIAASSPPGNVLYSRQEGYITKR